MIGAHLLVLDGKIAVETLWRKEAMEAVFIINGSVLFMESERAGWFGALLASEAEWVVASLKKFDGDLSIKIKTKTLNLNGMDWLKIEIDFRNGNLRLTSRMYFVQAKHFGRNVSL